MNAAGLIASAPASDSTTPHERAFFQGRGSSA